jgi:hypothetical protein
VARPRSGSGVRATLGVAFVVLLAGPPAAGAAAPAPDPAPSAPAATAPSPDPVPASPGGGATGPAEPRTGFRAPPASRPATPTAPARVVARPRTPPPSTTVGRASARRGRRLAGGAGQVASRPTARLRRPPLGRAEASPALLSAGPVARDRGGGEDHRLLALAALALCVLVLCSVTLLRRVVADPAVWR